ncbi:PREDICTED: uncharacterized protein LOC109462548 [Branchiostoma belcheri]|uniref:Uncharacterized protein LOC109462548 n=1 Tax=Branchiostoma belcheri TaxID=7741 RepID=A0A6P4Y7D4_BRABE|nr:PREDICTED: uncharacterized protein LOC109462548 [Branchiostoma belcheri]
MGHQRWICNSILQPRILEKARKHEIAIRLPKISSLEDSEYSIPAPATSAPCNTPEVCYLPPVPGASHATCKCPDRTDFKFKYRRYNKHDTTPAPATTAPCNTPEVCYLPPVPGALPTTCKCPERIDFKFKYKRYSNKHDDTWGNHTVVSRVDIGKHLSEDATQILEHQNDTDCTTRRSRKKRQNYRKFGIRRDRTEPSYPDNGQSLENIEDVRKCLQNKQESVKKEAKRAKVMIIIPCGTAKEDSPNDIKDDADENTSSENMTKDQKTFQSSMATKLPPIKNSCRKKTLMELPRIPVGEDDLAMSMARQSAVTCLKDETQLESSGSHRYRTDNRTAGDKLSLPTISFVHTQNILFTYPT